MQADTIITFYLRDGALISGFVSSEQAQTIRNFWDVNGNNSAAIMHVMLRTVSFLKDDDELKDVQYNIRASNVMAIAIEELNFKDRKDEVH